MNTNTKPRVFISYARSDGAEFARRLRERLEREKIPLWQDRVGMEGGRDWWEQIKEVIDHVEFMVLAMTPAALSSPVVRKEWRYARQQGVCVYPVIATPNLDFASLPRWISSAHFYNLQHEWPSLLTISTPAASSGACPSWWRTCPRTLSPASRNSTKSSRAC